MHWSDVIAEKVIERNPDKETYVCAAGISPSGSIHIGNFRDIATSLFVVKALQRKGKKAKLLFSWDEFDRLRKIPKNVEAINQGMSPYIGYPYVDAPNPFPDGCASYAEHFEHEFESAIAHFGIELEYRYQAQMYRSGAYVDFIIKALKKRLEIFDILEEFRTQDSAQDARDSYYPVSIYCPACHRDTTSIESLSEDCAVATYTCKCGHSGSFDFTRDFNCKLAWKIDWPMRWIFEEVDFEPGGKDHASPTGSYQTSSRIAREIFGHEPPLFQGYEFIGIKGATGKMSGSTGMNLTPGTLLDIYQPEVILWLYSKTEPTRAFDFCFDDGILRQYREFDAQYEAVAAGTADELTTTIIENCLINGHTIHTIPMNLIAQLGSIVNFNPAMTLALFEKIDLSYTEEELEERLPLARYWIEQCAPEMKYTLRTTRNWAVFDTLTSEEQADIAALHTYISAGDYSLESLQSELYDIIKTHITEEDEKSVAKKKQARFFSNVYELLLDKTSGPRLYLFLSAIDPEQYLGLLDFSSPKTGAEKDAEALTAAALASEALDAEAALAGEPFKPTIDLEAFNAVDLRTCTILECKEIAGSQFCYELRLADGRGERTIVSSIKEYYKPEDLVGRKIIVVVNLKPKKLSGVLSEGMLLAATTQDGRVTLLFADSAIPNGTAIR